MGRSMEKIILSLDASTKSTGWAVSIKGKYYKSGVIKASSPSLTRRIIKIRDEVLKLIQEYNANIIVLEDVRVDYASTLVTKALLWLHGALISAFYDYDKDLEIVLLKPSQWRAKLNIQGYRVKREEQKKIDIQYVNDKYNLSLQENEDDEADAIGILTAYLITEDKKPKMAF